MQGNKEGQLGFPSEFASREIKSGKDWLLAYVKAAWNEYVKYQGLVSLSDKKTRMRENYAYSVGRVDIDKLKEQASLNNTAYLNLNFNVSTPIPKYINMLVDDVLQKDLGLKISSIDPDSKTAIDKERAKMITNMLMRPLKQEVEKLTGNTTPDITKDEEPQDLAEIELRLETNFKQDMEVDMEQAINYVMYANDFEEIKRSVVTNIIVQGIAGTRAYFDENLNIRCREVDPFNLMTSPANKSDFSDIRYVGEIVEYTIAQFRLLSQGSFTEEQLQEIAKLAVTNSGGVWPYDTNLKVVRNESGGYLYDDIKVRIVELEIFSASELAYVEKKKKQGNGYFFEKKSADYKSDDPLKSVVRKTVKDIFKISWVQGTNYIYNYGLCENMMRPRSEGAYSTDVFSSFTLYAPEISMSTAKAMIERIIPFGDMCSLIDLKMQQHIAASRPKGLAVDVAAIATVTAGLGMEGGDFLDLQALYDQVGIYYFSSLREGGSPITNTTPIREIENGMSQDLERLANQYNNYIQQIRNVTGINPAREGATPDKGTLTGVMQMNLQGSENSTRFINNAYKYIIENTAKRFCVMVQDLAGSKEIYGMSNAIGEDTVAMLKLGKDISFKSFGIKIEFAPTAEELSYIDEQLKLALQTDTIAPEDAAFVRRLSRSSVKSAERTLAIRRRKYAREKEQAQLKMVESNSQSQIQIAQAAAESEAAKFNAKAQAEIAVLKEEYRLKMELQKLIGEEKLKQIALETEGKMEIVEASQEDEGGNVIKDKSVGLDNTSTGTNQVRQPSVTPSSPMKNL